MFLIAVFWAELYRVEGVSSRESPVAGYEGCCAAIVYCYFASLGLDVTTELSFNKGRIYLVLRFAGIKFVIPAIPFLIQEASDPALVLLCYDNNLFNRCFK